MARPHYALWLVFALGAAARAGDAPADRPIHVAVDVREAWSGLFRATVEIPVAPGPLRLCYRRWNWSAHAESDGIQRISHLSMRAGTQAVEWRRDEKDPWSFLCTVPQGADTLTVALALTADFEQDDWNWESGSTGSLALISWGDLLLYPAGHDVERLRARGSLRIPEGWSFATSLQEADPAEKGEVLFRDVSLSELVDSPVAIGRFIRRLALPVTTSRVPHALVVVMDRPLPVPDRLVGGLARAIEEAHAVLGPPPMDRYTFLLLASESLDGGGREHLRSSVVLAPDNLDNQPWIDGMLVHEYVHAWNGRRHLPAGMRVRDYQETPDFRLIWVYEGLTNYLSYVIAARSMLWDDTSLKWALANDAADARRQAPPGGWRSLEDVCATAPVHSRDLPWEDRRREQAQYGEGTLLWLEVDCLLRRHTGGEKSLDDFCRSFFSRTGEGPVVTYDRDAIVRTLSSLLDLDWSEFLRERVCTTRRDPTAGLRASGWEVESVSFPPEMCNLLQIEYRRNGRTRADLSFSIGAVVASDGTILDVAPGGPAEAAKIGPGAKITKVNGDPFDLPRLLRGVSSTKSVPLQLAVVHGGRTTELKLAYDGGLRWPLLVPGHGTDILSAIVASGD